MAEVSEAELSAMGRAVELAQSVARTSPNPKVGCLMLDAQGAVIGEGFHRGAAQPHAEIVALQDADAIPHTAVVTLEPCNHTGRTGPCAQALVAAGVKRVIYAQSDPNPQAAGGDKVLRTAGIEVVSGVLEEQAATVNAGWTFAITQGRPHVLWKVAATLDGRVAAPDGTSRWITGESARLDVHALRHEVDAIVVGSGTLAIDDPSLTARSVRDGAQPWRVVMGLSEVAATARVRVSEPRDRFLHIKTRDPDEALAVLAERDIQSVLLEGGPTLAATFLRADLVDTIRWYLAPALLGDGAGAVAGLGVGTMEEIKRFDLRSSRQLGADLRLDLVRPE